MFQATGEQTAHAVNVIADEKGVRLLDGTRGGLPHIPATLQTVDFLPLNSAIQIPATATPIPASDLPEIAVSTDVLGHVRAEVMSQFTYLTNASPEVSAPTFDEVRQNLHEIQKDVRTGQVSGLRSTTDLGREILHRLGYDQA